MELAAARFTGLGRSGHPAVSAGRRREVLLATLGMAGPLAIALAVAVKVPEPNLLIGIGLIAGTVGVVALAVSSRYEITLAFLALYLGMVDGVIKLEVSNQLLSSVRDLLIGAICIGALARLRSNWREISLPPLSGWVIAFVLLVVLEAANPNTLGPMKVVGGFRQHLEWIPFFFFGFAIMRSKQRFRVLFVLLGVIALANGIVSAYQTQLTPDQLAAWGPGYAERVNGTGAVSERVYTDETGMRHVRPPALGSDFRFGGYVGALALPGLLALMALGRRRGRWVVLLLALGALLAVATSLQREAVLGAVIGLLAFLMLSATAGRRVTRVLGAFIVVMALSVAIAAVVAPKAGEGVFSRYSTITPGKAASTSVDYRAETWSEIPKVLEKYPLGAGLSIVGAGTRFGGISSANLDGNPIGGESQYNYVADELGIVGLLFWITLSAFVIALAVRRLRTIGDIELRLELAAIFAAVIAFTAMGLANPTMSAIPYGPFFWFALGIASYWLAPRRSTQTRQIPTSESLRWT